MVRIVLAFLSGLLLGAVALGSAQTSGTYLVSRDDEPILIVEDNEVHRLAFETETAIQCDVSIETQQLISDLMLDYMECRERFGGCEPGAVPWIVAESNRETLRAMDLGPLGDSEEP